MPAEDEGTRNFEARLWLTTAFQLAQASLLTVARSGLLLAPVPHPPRAHLARGPPAAPSQQPSQGSSCRSPKQAGQCS